jgi:hypothetical protein
VNILEKRFWIFHGENPEIYTLFCGYTDVLISKGFTRHGAKAIIERIRWFKNVETNDPNFKICNDHTAYYARKWLKDHPEYPDFFELREVKGDEEDDDEEPPWNFNGENQGQLF